MRQWETLSILLLAYCGIVVVLGCALMKKILFIVFLGIIILISIGALSVTQLNDDFSVRLRKATEAYLNQYIEECYQAAKEGSLGFVDSAVLHVAALGAIGVSRFSYPEASTLLYHAIYGDGSDLRLDAEYFAASPYLKQQIALLGEGEHGPLTLRQSQDWRLSLAFNPYYLRIHAGRVTLFHPSIHFEPIDSAKPVITMVPIGKLQLRVYDNLISALNPTPFYAYSSWDLALPQTR